MISGISYNGHISQVPADIYKQAGASWVRLDWAGTSPESVMAVTRYYISQKLFPLLLVHKYADALTARKVFGLQIEIEFKNEPDCANMDAFDPEEYALLTKALASKGVWCWGPSISTWRSPDWWRGWIKAGGMNSVKGVSIHGYGYEPEEIPAMVKEVRTQTKTLPLLITEFGPGKPLPDKDRALWFQRAMKASKEANVPICLWRGPDEKDNSGLAQLIDGVWTALPVVGMLAR